MSSDETDGVPDGMKVDVEGRVYCTGPGGTWVFAPDGTRLGIIRTPEVPANLAFGGPDLRTLFFTARTSVYTLRVTVPGQPHPWYRRRARADRAPERAEAQDGHRWERGDGDARSPRRADPLRRPRPGRSHPRLALHRPSHLRRGARPDLHARVGIRRPRKRNSHPRRLRHPDASETSRPSWCAGRATRSPCSSTGALTAAPPCAPRRTATPPSSPALSRLDL